MENFIQIIDTYLLNYDLYKNGKIEFNCKYGDLIFLKKNPNILIIYGIYIYSEYRQQGLCKNILQYLIDNSKGRFKYFIIESVMSKILYEYLLRFNYDNRNFKVIKDGFLYKIKN